MKTILKYWLPIYWLLWLGFTVAIWPLPLFRYLAAVAIVGTMIFLLMKKFDQN